MIIIINYLLLINYTLISFYFLLFNHNLYCIHDFIIYININLIVLCELTLY